MSNKQRKKRNKTYTGADAALNRPVITKISAANRNPVSQWWFDQKRIAKPVIIAALVVAGIVILIIELVRISSGA